MAHRHNEIPEGHMKTEILLFLAMCVEPEIIILSEKSHG